jgi:L-fucose isomerase-like protein
MNNIPKVSLGLVAVSRDCFPIELSRRRREALLREC